jgi:hypothetical protein
MTTVKRSISLVVASALALGFGGVANAAPVSTFDAASPMAPAAVGPRTASGSHGDLTWTAQSLIVGMTPTAAGDPPRFPGPGDDPIFHASSATYSGVVPIIMQFSGGAFICSASLINRTTLLTAAHCVSDGFGTADPLLTTAYFQENLGPTQRPPTDGTATAITISEYFVNPLYSGNVLDHNDIAILRLSEDAPDWAQAYEMDLDADSLRGVDFNVAGYGNRSLNGGDGPAGGATGGTTGFIRQGDNMFDYRLGDPIFGDNWYTIFGQPASQLEFSYISDFDSGRAGNDQACLVAQAGNVAGPAGAIFCDLGRGDTEVSVAGGDSGGPQFDANGRIVSVTSYGLSFGVNFGDCRSGLQSSCGEMNGFAPLYASADWIRSILEVPVPVSEPATLAMLLGGLGFAVRRRRLAA